jgi:hypothetical protein
MNSSTSSYHDDDTFFLGLSPVELSTALRNRCSTIRVLNDVSPVSNDVPPSALRVLSDELESMAQVEERRNGRLDRLAENPLHVARLHLDAANIVTMLPIEEYVASVMPWVSLQRNGHRIRSRCVFLGCSGESETLTIFGGDFAWCDACDRGGNLFSVIGLCEALDRPEDLLRRAAEVVGYELAARSHDRSLTGNSYRGKPVSERFTVKKNAGSPSRVPRLSGGRVVAS